ncbi:phosphate regulon transcriptional regulator PhoB [Crenothrix polyspora]|jgi:two-component system, OmpR family, phosphate regulon response regulator PhoB|uniref:Phosphate regulon transcriptional regulatory protein PhoB n=1 Tax=Crenothrix polyspora TaxID=360316 RepID=A0A1R4H620_9GAMM|nr:phosphate regulon transcriptional regulator PhoB [Crenothrix polyspora]SJM91310.1 DNA-binding response regulator in two-component regulatory system with PhoR (or CreC) [Crenothrix polyspora]
MSQFNILVVEDEEAIRQMLVLVLEQAGFAVLAADSAAEAQNALYKTLPDLIVLDWMMPVTSGVEWVRRLKKDALYQEIPVILLTARGEEEDKIKGLEVGADDYMTKPFSPKELIARIRAVLRRAGKISATDIITLGDLQLDIGQHRFSIDQRQVEISPTEFRMVQFFISHPDKVFSRSQLLDQIWGRSVFIEERTIDVHIRRLRKILDEYGRGDLLQTVRGFGYKFSLTDATVVANTTH